MFHVRRVILVVATGAVASSAAAALASSGQIIFSDDFSNRHSGWPVGHDKISVTNYKDGQYWISIKKPDEDSSVGNDLKKVVPAADMQLDATEHTGASGDEVILICYTNIDRDIGYYFSIGPRDDFYAIRRFKGAASKLLIKGFDPHAIRGVPEQNHLSARCIGANNGRPATLTFFVNRSFVAQAQDSKGLRSFAGIGVDLYSQRGGSVASFDNALVREH